MEIVSFVHFLLSNLLLEIIVKVWQRYFFSSKKKQNEKIIFLYNTYL